MTNTTDTEDRETYNNWLRMQQEQWLEAGNLYWFDTAKAARMRNKGSHSPENAFVGPYWAVKPWLTEEAIFWFEHYGHERYTFTEWRAKRREQRKQEAEYDAEASSPLATLEYMRELMARRGALIAEARADGASWADVMTATGLSRMQCFTLAKNATMAADSEAVALAAAEAGEVAF